MRAMQYTIQLPGDFDENQVRQRVTARAQVFDNLEGLLHKSFLFNSQDHIYAPFYIWQNSEASRKFLLDDLFKGVIDTFNRPRVRTWSILTTRYGNTAISPKFAVREADLISPEINLSDMVKKEIEKQEKIAQNPNLYFHVVALDADRWEIIRYSLWKSDEALSLIEADCAQTYEVLHISEPQARQNLPKTAAL